MGKNNNRPRLQSPGLYVPLEAIEETRALTEFHRRDFEKRAIPFFDALADVRCAIAQIEILSVASGGDKTAEAFARCADQLTAAMNAFSREVQSISSNPFADVHHRDVQALAQQCNALRMVANEYALARADQRSSLQRKIADAISHMNPLIASLRRAPRANDQQLDLVAMMLRDRLNNPAIKHYGPALEDLRVTEPTIYAEFFAWKTKPQMEAYARQLMARRKV